MIRATTRQRFLMWYAARRLIRGTPTGLFWIVRGYAMYRAPIYRDPNMKEISALLELSWVRVVTDFEHMAVDHKGRRTYGHRIIITKKGRKALGNYHVA